MPRAAEQAETCRAKKAALLSSMHSLNFFPHPRGGKPRKALTMQGSYKAASGQICYTYFYTSTWKYILNE